MSFIVSFKWHSSVIHSVESKKISRVLIKTFLFGSDESYAFHVSEAVARRLSVKNVFKGKHLYLSLFIMLSLLRNCLKAYPFQCHDVVLSFYGISRSLFPRIFSITVSHRCDIILVKGFLNVLKWHFHHWFKHCQWTTLLLKVTQNEKRWLVRYLWL